MIIRDALDTDMPPCRDIYNALVDSTTVAWTEQKQTLRERQSWFRRQQRAGYPVLVAQDTIGVVGFASYGSFRGSGKWTGYRHTVEHTIHVDRGHWGQGVGRSLMDELTGRAHSDGVHVMVGAIDSDNIDSIRFHERLGFVETARMPEVGYKFGRWLDLVLMQRILE